MQGMFLEIEELKKKYIEIARRGKYLSEINVTLPNVFSFVFLSDSYLDYKNL